MIIRIVRAYQPFSLLLIPLIGVLLWMPAFLHPSAPSPTVPMPAISGLASFCTTHPLFSVITGFLLLLTQSFFLNFIINHHLILTKKSWLPALIMVVLGSSTPGMLWLHAQMISGLLLLGALYFLLGTYRMDRAFTSVFNSGLLIGLAGLFYAPSMVFLLFGIIAILILRPFIWREWIIFLLGILIPWVYSGVYFFWNDRLQDVTHTQLIDPIRHRDFFLKLAVEFYSLTIMTGLLLLVAAGRFVAGSGTSTLKTKKAVSVMIWFLLFAMIAVLPAQNYAIAGFTFCLYPVALFISNYFLLARRVWIAELIFLSLMASIIVSYVMKWPL